MATMNKGDIWRCAECDDEFEHQISLSGSFVHPTTKELWCDGCVDAAGFSICDDCDAWIPRSHSRRYLIDERTAVWVCDACYYKRMPPADEKRHLDAEDAAYYDQESVRWQCLTPQEQDAEQRAHQHIAGAWMGI